MRKATHRVVGYGIVGVTLAAALASGCSGDDSGTGGSPGGNDASIDQTNGNPDGSSEPDVAVGEASSGGAEASTNDAGNGGDGAAFKDGAALDATSAPDVADASTTPDASGGDASDAASACVTTPASLGASSAADASPSAVVIADFDGPADAGAAANWSTFSVSGVTDTLSPTGSDGHPCPGALNLEVASYSYYGTNIQAYYNYNSDVQDWTGYTKLHAWLKVVSSEYDIIQGVEPRVDSHSYSDKLYGGFVSGATFADGNWHEAVVPLTSGASYDPTEINGYQFELQLVGAQPSGAPATPPPASLLIDSIWIE